MIGGRGIIAVLCVVQFLACSGASDPVEMDQMPGDQEAEADLDGRETGADSNPDTNGDELSFGTDIPEISETTVADSFGPEPGEVGATCESDSQCLEGFCIQTADGMVCTQTCQEECPFGWECLLHAPSLPDQIYICAPTFVALCLPCLANSECWTNGVDAGEVCLSYGGEGSFCGGACQENEECPPGYQCVDGQDVAGGSVSQCMSTDGPCECSQWYVDQGASTDCHLQNDWGTCWGTRQCKASGLTDCSAQTPAPESCNGTDDDCDGAVDEETGGDECLLLNENGACVGVHECQDGVLVCVGEAALPEQCDGLDNDCDGQVDEGFEDTNEDGIADCMVNDKDGDGIADGPDNCPTKFNPGQADNDLDNFGDACDADDDNDQVADEDDCAPMDELVYPGANEICDASDNNCNFLVDEGFADTDGDGWKDCVDEDDDDDGTPDDADCGPQNKSIHPGAKELCDGLDNNCDQFVDEGFGEQSCGVGNCLHTVPLCADGQMVLCDPQEGAAEEVCDGVDNDCDVVADEGFPDFDKDGIKDCVDSDDDDDGDPDLTDCAPLDASQHGAAAEICDGVDNNCNGSVDEELGSISCGKGECAHTVELCMNGAMQLCDPFEGVAEEVCDGVDNDCNGLVDEGEGTLTCGLGLCLHTVPACTDGEPTACDPLEGAQEEFCDGLDNDCDAKIDEELPTLACGKGNCFHTVLSCIGGVEFTCNPFTGALPEVCDGADNDCDGDTDEELGTSSCGLGICNHTQPNCVGGVPQACNPFAGVEVESCDDLDNNCNGLVDDQLGSSSCGKGACQHTVSNCIDGEPQLCDPLAGAGEEVCDGQDNDCDGSADEELGNASCGLGECAHEQANCVGGQPQDCDPLEGSIPEVCDALDNNCDGDVDEGFDDTDDNGVPDCLDPDDDGDGDLDEVDCAPTDPTVGPSTEEICYNDVDDDCNADTPDMCHQRSCLKVLEAAPQSANGLYTIDPDGNGPADIIEVFCDMTMDGGGWTLVAVNGDNHGMTMVSGAMGNASEIRRENPGANKIHKFTDAVINAIKTNSGNAIGIRLIYEANASIRKFGKSACTWESDSRDPADSDCDHATGTYSANPSWDGPHSNYWFSGGLPSWSAGGCPAWQRMGIYSSKYSNISESYYHIGSCGMNSWGTLWVK
jgi:hypothetical protein